jgi:peptidoglycan/xylan/chitin deacetylase (PgdA/CDA1 family)
MKILTSWDDGHEQDLKVISLLRRYELPGIFFVPVDSWGFKNLEMYKGFEIGGHTIDHPQDLKLLRASMLRRQLASAKVVLDAQVKDKLGGEKTEWFCYPRGRYNEKVIGFVRRAGFKYARTTKVGEVKAIDKQNNFEISTTVHVGYNRKEYGGKDWLDYALSFDFPRVECYNIFGHSWEIDKYGQWEKLETFFKKMRNLREGI